MITNLDKLNIVSVSIFGILDYNRQQEAGLTAKIRTYRKGWPRYSFERLGVETHQGFAHHIEFSLSHSKESRNIRARLKVHEVGAAASIPDRARNKQAQALDDILDVLREIEVLAIDSHCHAHVSWDYEPRTHDTVISLPMFHTSGNTLPFEFISGARFIRPSDNGDISIIIDTTREGQLFATAQIPLEDKLSLGLVDTVIAQATGVIGDFIFESSS